MALFGRPELSVRNVELDLQDPEDVALNAAIIRMMNNFIGWQALGGWIDQGREVRAKGVPLQWFCCHQGTLDNPEFNYFHVEIGLEPEQGTTTN